ncbi:hypothetical protein SRHO_G00328310, partial [Serrasalmus rhombeus]
SSLLARTEPFFIHQARRPPVINASYGTLFVEQLVPLELLQTPGTFVASSTLFTFNWKVQTFVLTEKIYLDKPKVQVLFYIAGRDWDDYSTVDKLPCVRMFAFHETQEVRGSCRLRSELGICVAELEPLPGWFAPPSVVPGRQRGTDLSKGTPVELYYSLHSVESSECLGEESGVRNSARLEQEDMFGSATSTPMRRIGSVRLFRTPAVPELSEHRLDGNFAVLVPSAPVRPRDSVSAYVAASPYSPVEMFTLRVKLKDGVAFLGARPCNPTLWMVSQDVRTEGHKVVTLHCRRKESSYGQRVEPGWQRVVQVDLEMDVTVDMVGNGSISWMVEYPGIRAGSEETETQIHIVQKELAGVIPLAMSSTRLFRLKYLCLKATDCQSSKLHFAAICLSHTVGQVRVLSEYHAPGQHTHTSSAVQSPAPEASAVNESAQGAFAQPARAHEALQQWKPGTKGKGGQDSLHFSSAVRFNHLNYTH